MKVDGMSKTFMDASASIDEQMWQEMARICKDHDQSENCPRCFSLKLEFERLIEEHLIRLNGDILER